jgi:hypothetical protein
LTDEFVQAARSKGLLEVVLLGDDRRGQELRCHWCPFQ